MPAQLGGDFDLERILRFGSIPAIWQAEEPQAALDAYVQLYVKEEVRAEALVRNLPAFLRFLPVAGLTHGQVINIAGLARDAAAASSTVEGYLNIVQDTLLAMLLPAFEPRLRVRERQHPKLYWVDPGWARATNVSSDLSARKNTGPCLRVGFSTYCLPTRNRASSSTKLRSGSPLKPGKQKLTFCFGVACVGSKNPAADTPLLCFPACAPSAS